MNQSILTLPPPYRDQNYDKIPLIKGRLTFTGNNGETYLTSQELACLQALSKGASYKEIAQRLDLSSRSVETYFNRIKDRTAMTLDAVQLRLVSP